mmetsp:Transcript_66634/g.156864  ORF Transcript_66634/g.156864 Transcript_66634/m.156864 type:complete len:284 (+) Transcript_66634:189-1040(+)
MKSMPSASQLIQAVHEPEVVVGLCVRKGCVLAVILGIHVCAHLQQQHARLEVPPSRSCMDRRALLVVSAVDVRTPLDESANGIHIVVLRCDVQGSPPLRVRGIDLDAVDVQELHEVVPLSFGDNVESCLATMCLRHELRPTSVAKLGQAQVPRGASELEQRHVGLHIHGIDVRVLQEPLEHVHEHGPGPAHDLLEVEGLSFLLDRLESTLQISKGIGDLGILCLHRIRSFLVPLRREPPQLLWLRRRRTGSGGTLLRAATPIPGALRACGILPHLLGLKNHSW